MLGNMSSPGRPSLAADLLRSARSAKRGRALMTPDGHATDKAATARPLASMSRQPLFEVTQRRVQWSDPVDTADTSFAEREMDITAVLPAPKRQALVDRNTQRNPVKKVAASKSVDPASQPVKLVTATRRPDPSMSPPRATLQPRPQWQASLASENARETLPRQVENNARRPSLPLEEYRPSWNSSTVLEPVQPKLTVPPPEASLRVAREQSTLLRGLLVGGLYDPTYIPKLPQPEEPPPPKQKTPRRQRPPKPVSPAPPQELAMPSMTLFTEDPLERLPPHPKQAAMDAESKYNATKSSLEQWLTSLGILVDPADRASYHAPAGNGAGYFASLLADGVLLSELVTALEVKSGARPSGLRCKVSGAAGPMHIEVLPGTVLPKNGHISVAAATKNLELCLSLLRERPKVNSTYLWTSDELRGGGSEDISVGLLDDIRKGYTIDRRKPLERAKQAPKQPPRQQAVPVANAREVGMHDMERDSLESAPTFEETRSEEFPTAAPVAAPESAQASLLVARRFKPNTLGSGSEEPGQTGLHPSASLKPRLTSMFTTQKARPHLQFLAEPVAVPVEVLPLLPSATARGLRAGERAVPAPAITSEVMAGVRNWLESLRLQGFLSWQQGYKHVLEDPLFNGTLLVELIRKLDPDRPPLGGKEALRPFKTPKSIAEARANIEAVMTILRTSPFVTGELLIELRDSHLPSLRSQPEIPRSVFWCTEELLVGNKQFAWALLDAIRVMYTWQDAIPAHDRTGRPLTSPRRQPKLVSDIGPQEAMLVPVRAPIFPVTPQFAPVFSPIENQQTGGRRHSMTEVLTSVRDQEREVVIWLSSLGFRPDLSVPFAESSQSIVGYLPAIANGSLLALVVEILRKQPVQGIIYPALTRTTALRNIEKCIHALRDTNSFARRYVNDDEVATSVLDGKLDLIVGLLYDCLRFYRGEPPIGSPKPHFTQEYHPIVSVPDLGTKASTGRAARAMSPHAPHRLLNDTLRDTRTSTAPMAVQPTIGDDRTLDKTGRASHAGESQQAMHNGKPAETVPARVHKEASFVTAIASWLASIGLELHHPEQLLDDNGCATEFMDGTFLVRVVEACENLKGLRREPIAGVDKQPKNGASKLANIRRALELLRENRAMPLDHLWSELAIRDGNPKVIRTLLSQIRRAYGFHIE